MHNMGVKVGEGVGREVWSLPYYYYLLFLLLTDLLHASLQSLILHHDGFMNPFILKSYAQQISQIVHIFEVKIERVFVCMDK